MSSVQALPRNRSFDSAILSPSTHPPRTMPASTAQPVSSPKVPRERPANVAVSQSKVWPEQNHHPALVVPPPGPKPSSSTPAVAAAHKTLTIAIDVETLIQTDGTGPLRAHAALPALQKFLSINNAVAGAGTPHVEMVLLCHFAGKKSHLLAALRAANLPIERVLFTRERPLLDFLKPFEAMLYLSCDPSRVRHAVAQGIAAGCLLARDVQDATGEPAMAGSPQTRESAPVGGIPAPDVDMHTAEDLAPSTLQVAFDFDGVLADDLSEIRFKSEGLEAFHAYEDLARQSPMGPGPAAPLALAMGALRDQLLALRASGVKIPVDIRIAVVTARGGVAIDRLFCTLEAWNFEPDEVFCLGGRDKTPFIRSLNADLYIDDQEHHARRARNDTLAVHMPSRSSLLLS